MAGSLDMVSTPSRLTFLSGRELAPPISSQPVRRIVPMSESLVLIVEPKLAAILGKRLWSDPRFNIFPATEVMRALEIIVRRPPTTVILDPMFVTTSRGTALVARIRHDARLAKLDLRVLTHADDLSTVPLTEWGPSGAAAAARKPLDRWGTRSSVRVVMKSNVTVLVNGRPCQLLNLSLTGAQILSPGRVSPQQRVQLTLREGRPGTGLDCIIIWAVVEPAGTDLQYRAGLSFTNPDGPLLESFCRCYALESAPTS